jgi:hypothetical protein
VHGGPLGSVRLIGFLQAKVTMILRVFVVLGLTLSFPVIAGAQEQPRYVGKQACVACHASEQKTVAGTPHETGKSCEGCHGAGEAHVRTTGDNKNIFSFRRATAAEIRERCGQCHANPTMARHAVGDVSCTACHSSHHYIKKRYLLRPADDMLQHPAAIPDPAFTGRNLSGSPS